MYTGQSRRRAADGAIAPIRLLLARLADDFLHPKLDGPVVHISSMEAMRFRLRPHSPFRLDLMARALRRRPRNLIDRWDGTRYSRILLIDGSPLHLVVRQTAPSGRPEIECICACLHRAPKPERVSAAVERLLGLNVNMTGFRRLARRDAHLRALVGRFAGFHPPRFATVFEAAVNAICCQQLSLEAGLELLNRLSSRTGTRFKDAGESLFRTARTAQSCPPPVG
jgi:DNA-3-methyladenine glycosylase II